MAGTNALDAPRGANQAAPTQAAHRYRTVVDVYVLLRRSDGMILLLERSGTGYADGQLCPPSGHLELGESVAGCAAREAAEEVGRILQALEQCAGNQTRAAKLLGISRGTLVSRLETYSIARPRKNV